jgi:hypothetical protein
MPDRLICVLLDLARPTEKHLAAACMRAKLSGGSSHRRADLGGVDVALFAVWLSATPVRLFIQTVLWIIPAVQTVHRAHGPLAWVGHRGRLPTVCKFRAEKQPLRAGPQLQSR